MARRSRPRSAPQPSVPSAAIVGAAVVLVVAGAMVAGPTRGKRVMPSSVEAASRQASAQSKQAVRREQQQQGRSPDRALYANARSIDNVERDCQQLLTRLTRANQELRELIDGLRAKK